MQRYSFYFDSGLTVESMLENDIEAQGLAETLLEERGYNPDDIVSGNWDSDGYDEFGEPQFRMLFWANEEDAKNDPGVKAICQLCRGE